MLVLGVTADDKGAQLETLVRSVLTQQGYVRVRSNVVGAGGNELDVEAERESAVVGGTQITPLTCEAKAYADAVNMPTWQKFLGKLFIERTREASTIGALVALNGINGNVAGSYKELQNHDSALFVFEGTHLEQLARDSGELAEMADVLVAAETQFHRIPQQADTMYYGGTYYWVLWWRYEREYSVVDARGGMLPTDEVEQLRQPLEASLSGELLATDEAVAEAQARHDDRLFLMGRLFRGLDVALDIETGPVEAINLLSQEPFCRVADGKLELLAPDELDAAAISRLFVSLFEDAVKVTRLSFMTDRVHAPYTDRLIELLPDLQAGFQLDEAEAVTLRELAVLFPSVWATLASSIEMITTHRADGQEVVDDAVLESDRTAFWEAVIAAIESDYSNQRLRGFLYDYMGVAELHVRREFMVKSKRGPLGRPISIETRTAVRQFQPDPASDPEVPTYIMVRLLPTISEPWDDRHPEPEFPLESD